jgi:copper chaperone CopZ
MGTTYDVAGMTCNHCVHAVTTEVSAIEGVTDVTVDLQTGRVTVEGTFTDDQVAAAVDEAGYAVT